ncbi:GSCFA domain-containing protein [Hymenobacter humi]|uniref:GSCFA domain-containing protein n=1 Tax=Hymenobacter humi TaxID=1411620 RepID=A0ABW2U6S8_9BACT
MFRTELSIAPATDQLPRTARVLTMGSCFADSIGSRLLANKVEALVNPLAPCSSPWRWPSLLRAAAGEEVDWQQHLVEARGRWQSYDLHGSIGADSPVELLQAIQEPGAPHGRVPAPGRCGAAHAGHGLGLPPARNWRAG